MTTVELTKFKGIYVAPEAASYLTATLRYDINRAIANNINVVHPVYPINSRNLIRWVRVGLTSPELRSTKGTELLIGFEDLISMRVISILRSLGVSWNSIHRAEKWLRDQTGYPRPFAVERVWTETENVFAEFHDTFVAATRHGQLAFPIMLGQYLRPVEDMSFQRHNGVNVANSWNPHKDVLIDPEIQFGEPCIKGTRMRTRIVWEYLQSGDTQQHLMRAFDLSEIQLNHAVEWEQRLQRATCERPRPSVQDSVGAGSPHSGGDAYRSGSEAAVSRHSRNGRNLCRRQTSQVEQWSELRTCQARTWHEENGSRGDCGTEWQGYGEGL